MEGTGQAQAHPHARERSSRPSLPPPLYPRASSRSSNSTTNTRMTPQSNNSSSTNLASPHKSHTSHRFPHHSSRASTGSAERPRSSRLSREPTLVDEPPRQGTPAVSAYLQEKLQRERKFESERASSRAATDMSTSTELRAVQSSPVRASTSDGRRPRSSSGADPLKKKSMGLKEMELTLSKLHKNNFDLKLEVFHRRERQTELEAQVEKLTTEKNEMTDVNEQLVAELERRDKAVEEAVAMIVMLEATVERLRQEREMAQLAGEAYDYSLPPGFDSSDLQTPRVKEHSSENNNNSHLLLPSKDDFARHSLARMPSFLSDRSECTENLRSVYMSANESLLGFRRALDGLRDEDLAQLNGMSTPSLSVLSESSFISVYGQRGPGGPRSSTSPPDRSHPHLMSSSSSAGAPFDDRRVGAAPTAGLKKQPGSAFLQTTTTTTPTKPRRSSSVSRNISSGGYSSINDVIGAGSPLQKLERLQFDQDRSSGGGLVDVPSISSSGSGSGGPPATSRPLDRDRQGSRSPQLPPLHTNIQTRQRTKQEKREALRKVMTDAPLKDFANNNHPFPPTPDTISTSTLRRYKNSNDTLSQPAQAPSLNPNERSYLALSESTAASMSSRSGSRDAAHVGTPGTGTGAGAVDDNYSGGGGSLLLPHKQQHQTPSTSAFTSRKGEITTNGTKVDHTASSSSYFENRLPVSSRRPRSAGETTTSHDRRGANGWGSDDSSDDDDDGNIDGASVSSYDCWLREGLKPNRRFPNNDIQGAILGLGPAADASSPTDADDFASNGRVSPDLFGFPTSGPGGGWASDAMFGALGGAGYLGAPTAQALDALGASLPAPQAGIFGSGLASPGPFAASSSGATGGVAVGGPASFVPPPPRRSSLHARTGSSHRPTTANSGGPSSSAKASPAPGGASKLRKSPVRGGGGGSSASRSRSNSLDNTTAAPTPTSTSTETTQQHPQQQQQKRHYPPIAGHPPPSRRSGGLNSLFRRSLGGGGSSDVPAPPASAPPSETAFKNVYPLPPTPTAQSQKQGQRQQDMPMVGVPSWVRSRAPPPVTGGGGGGAGDEELMLVHQSATPPPILRNPRVRRESAPAPALAAGGGYDVSGGGGMGEDRDGGGAPLCSPSAGVGAALPSPIGGGVESAGGGGQTAAANNSGGGGRVRNWLGLGRVGSLRNRAG